MSKTEIRFRCPRCIGETVTDSDQAGKNIYCRYCGNQLTVPSVSDRPRTEADPSQLYEVDPVPQDVRSRYSLIKTVQYTCSLCGTRIEVGEKDAGVRRSCPDCGTPFVIRRSWLISELQRAKERRCQSWTDPARRLYSESYETKNTPDIYCIEGGTSPEVSVPEPVKKTDALVRVICGLCGTVMYAPVSQIGQKMQCPDCETWTEVQQTEDLEISGTGIDVSVVPESISPLLSAPPKDRHLVRIVCGLCGTIMYAHPSQMGKKVQCPDCETWTEVSLSASPESLDDRLIEPASAEIYGLAEETPPLPPLQ